MKYTSYVAAFLLSAGMAAADCADITVEDAFDLEEADINALYTCLGDTMAEGYAKEGDEIGSTFRDWAVTATRAAVAGPHGNLSLIHI